MRAYRAIDLGTLGGPRSAASAINGIGQVVGGAHVTEEVRHAFLWQDGIMTDLDTFDSEDSFASSVNSRGQIVGWARRSDGLDYACLWENGSMELLDGPGGPPGTARCINDIGQIAGQRDRRVDPVYGGPGLAVLWDGPTSIELCTAACFGQDAYRRHGSAAFAINNAGQIVGSAPGDPAFLWDAGEITLFGLAETRSAYACAINDRGQVVGWAQVNDDQCHAFLWDSGRIVDLGTLGGPEAAALGINIHGSVVGRSFTAEINSDGEPIEERGFLWQDGILMDLNALLQPDSGWLVTAAEGIDDAGRIVGEGIHKGQSRALLLEPL